MPSDSPYFKNISERLGLTTKFRQLPKELWTWCEKVRVIVEGKKRSFDLIPMWREIYENPAHDMMVMGGRQVTKTTWITDSLGHIMTTDKGATAFYITDNERHLSEFSNHKFRQGCIEQNALIKERVKGGKVGKVTEIKFADENICYIGTDEGQYSQVESTSPSIVFLDEAQYQELQFLPKLFESMSMTRGKIRLVGVGGESGGPLESEWLKTDQREWHYKDPDWYDKLKFNNDSPAKIINTPEELAIILDGKWIAKRPENYLYPGYHLPQTIFSHIPRTVDDAVRKYRIHPRFSLEYKERNYPKSIYLTHVLGAFYHATRRPISRAMVEACMIPYGQYYLMTGLEVKELKRTFGNEIRILAGIDFGSGPAASSTVVAIVIKWKKSGRYQLAWIERRPQENLDDQAEYLANLLNEYQIDLGVGDLGYGAQQVKHIQEGGANRITGRIYEGVGINRFLGCRTIGDEAKPQQQFIDKVDEHGEELGRLQIDKTTSIQKFVDFMEWYENYLPMKYEEKPIDTRRPKLMIPFGNPIHVEWLINEWTSLTRKDIKEIEDVEVVDPRQRARKEFNHPKDSLMAMIYVLTADEQEEGGFDIHGVGLH